MSLHIFWNLINIILLLPFLKSFFYFYLFDYFFNFYTDLNLDFFYFFIWWNNNNYWILNFIIFCIFIVNLFFIISNFKINDFWHYWLNIFILFILFKFINLMSIFLMLFL